LWTHGGCAAVATIATSDSPTPPPTPYALCLFHVAHCLVCVLGDTQARCLWRGEDHSASPVDFVWCVCRCGGEGVHGGKEGHWGGWRGLLLLYVRLEFR
jgi:hypothetical protein